MHASASLLVLIMQQSQQHHCNVIVTFIYLSRSFLCTYLFPNHDLCSISNYCLLTEIYIECIVTFDVWYSFLLLFYFLHMNRKPWKNKKRQIVCLKHKKTNSHLYGMKKSRGFCVIVSFLITFKLNM